MKAIRIEWYANKEQGWGMKENRNDCIDTIKGLACIAVVLIHYNWSNDFGVFVKAISRFAVPFFFFVSGYYLLDSNLEIASNNVKRKIKNIISMTLRSAIVYMIFCVIWNLLMDNNWSLLAFIKEKITLARILKLFLTNDPFVYAHFWYLLALVYNYLFIYFVGNRIKDWWYLIFAMILMMGFSLLVSFTGILDLENYYPIFNTGQYIVLSNLFVFRALPFFLFGIFVRKKKQTIEKIKINKLDCIILIIFGSLIAFFEDQLFGVAQFYVGSYIVVISLILISIVYPNSKIEFLKQIGNKLSMYIYIYHILVGKVFDLIASKFNFWSYNFWKNIRAILICITSIVVAWVIVATKKTIAESHCLRMKAKD